MTAVVVGSQTLAELLGSRADPMAACGAEWLRKFTELPADAALPLAMSGPHERAVGSYGAECVAWAEAEWGVRLRWWQALAVTRQLEHDDRGRLVWREIVESGPRRIGKSTRLRLSATWRVAHAPRFHEDQLSMLVSKDLAVGKEIHRGSWRWAEDRDWKVLRLNGGQEIETPAGDGRWLLRAPNAAYGYDVGYGQVDESWGVDPQAITDGLEPALLERESPQLHLTSTAHVKASSLMRRRLTVALRDADPDVLLLLWGAHPDLDVGEESTWRAASPHWSTDRRDLIRRKYNAALAGVDEPEFDDPDPVRGWAAQYLNVWPLLIDSAVDTPLPGWDDCAVAGSAPDPAAIGVAVSVDRLWASIGAASGTHVGSVSRRAGTGWVAGEAKRIQDEYGCDVALDSRGPAADLTEEFDALGIQYTATSTAQYLDACARLFDRVQRRTVEHGDYDDLNAAVRNASKRSVNDRWAWARKTGDVSMLEAVTLAAWAADRPAPTVW